MKKLIVTFVSILSFAFSTYAKAPYTNVKTFKSKDLALEQFKKIKTDVADLFLTIESGDANFRYVVKTKDGAVLVEVKKENKTITTVVTEL